MGSRSNACRGTLKRAITSFFLAPLLFTKQKFFCSPPASVDSLTPTIPPKAHEVKYYMLSSVFPTYILPVETKHNILNTLGVPVMLNILHPGTVDEDPLSSLSRQSRPHYHRKLHRLLTITCVYGLLKFTSSGFNGKDTMRKLIGDILDTSPGFRIPCDVTADT